MSVLYPRTITVRRQNTPSASGGSVSFGGDSPAQETVIASGLCASIQYKRVGTANPTNLPSDSRRSQWLIIIPSSATVQKGLITENDIIVDDLSKRYQVYAADFQVTGYSLYAELLNS